jgi:DNA-binding MarR family transcriptional regulator
VAVSEGSIEEREAPAALRAPDGPGMTAWRAFLQAHAEIMRRLEAELDSEQSMSLADFDVLIQLSRALEHGLRMGDLADRVLLSRSGMTRRVDRLETAGLVARRDCDADRRGAYAVITPLGLERLRAALPTHLRGVDEHFLTHLGPDEMDVVTGVMRRLARRAVGSEPRAAADECLPARVSPTTDRATPARRDH